MQRVLLVRHAQCEMNLVVDERVGGRTNHSPLTPLGNAQAAMLGAHLRAALLQEGVQPQRLRFYSSTAVRAVDTARHVMAALELDPASLTQSKRLLELEQGEWEGLVRKECYTPELTAQFAADPWGVGWNFAAPGGESQRQVEQRMLAYLMQRVLPGLPPGERAIVVSHGMAIRCTLRGILGSLPTMSRNIATGNTSITELGFVPHKGSGSSSSSSSNGSLVSNGGQAGGQAGVTNGGSSAASPGAPGWEGGVGAPGGTERSRAGPPGDGSWHVLRMNDLSHLPHDQRS